MRFITPISCHYNINYRREYTKSGLHELPADDDMTYTILNLLLEKYGRDYTVEDVGKLWVDILPVACTVEDYALQELKGGRPAKEAACYNNCIELIGAAIRADPFGYACAGDPVSAAKLCYNDAFLTHRKNGIYGEMFCAVAIVAAFTSETPLDAVREGMKQIPEESELYKALAWALEQEPANYIRARVLIDDKFGGMDFTNTRISTILRVLTSADMKPCRFKT